METLSFSLLGARKVGEIVLQRQLLSQNSGRPFSVGNDDFYIPHLHQKLSILGLQNSNDLR